MKWFEGDIPAAVTTSQAKKAVFVVAILGSDEASQGLEKTLESAEVQSVLAKPEQFVCIRIEPNSASHTAFSQLYTGAPAASAYMISLNAMPLDIVKAPVTPSELKKRLEVLLEKHWKLVNPNPSAVASTTSVAGNQADAGSTATVNTAQSVPESCAVVGEGESPSSEDMNRLNANIAADSASAENISLEEKIRRAKELAAAKQLLKQKEEEEEHKRREVERREAGKGMAELKRWQEEQEMKRVLDERKKDKEADKLLRQKLRDQIAADRAARNAKTNAEFLEQKAQQQSESVSASAGPTQRIASSSNIAANFAGQARLSFRTPDGGSQTHAFDPDSTLGHVRQFLLDNGNLPFRSFSISIAFPRKQFTQEEYGKTLRELGLLPTAALLLLPSSGLSSNRVTSSSGGLWTFITALISYLLFPVNMVWSMVQRALPGAGGAATGRAGGQPNPRARAPGSDSTSNQPNAAREAASKRQAKRDQSSNVHRLRNADDDDEDNATWNGNSTQQM